jgi:hypothetical protein
VRMCICARGGSPHGHCHASPRPRPGPARRASARACGTPFSFYQLHKWSTL